MNRKRPASSLALYLGIACLVLAGGGLAYSLLSGGEPAAPAHPAGPVRTPAPPHIGPTGHAEPVAAPAPAGAGSAAAAPASGPAEMAATPPDATPALAATGAPVADTTALAPIRVPRPVRDSRAQAERRQQQRQAVQARAAGIADTLDLSWFAAHFEQVPDTTSLRAYVTQVLDLGQRAAPADTAAPVPRVRPPHTDEPRGHIREAKEVIYAARPSRKALAVKARSELAVAFYLEARQARGVERMDPVVSMSFYKEQAALLEQLAQKAAQRDTTKRAQEPDTTDWVTPRVQALEAGALDAFVRVRRLEDRIGRRPGGLPADIGPRAVRPAALHKALDEALLQLGRARLEAARAETRDLERVQQQTQAAFEILAMVYRRSSSDKALQAMVRVAELQANARLEMARASCVLAQQAAAAADTVAAAEYYYRATQRYNECLAEASGPERDELLVEYMRVKRDVAAWYARDRAAVAARKEGL